MASQIRSATATKVMDFTREDLTKYSSHVLELVLVADISIRETKPEILPFFAMCNAARKERGQPLPKKRLTELEKTTVVEYMSEQAKKVPSLDKVMDTLLEKKNISITKDGISWDESINRRKMVQPVLPDHDVGKVGGQLLAGAIIASVARVSTGTKKTDTKVLKSYLGSVVSQTSMMKFQVKILEDLDTYFRNRQMKGPGREYIHEILLYLKDRPLEEYFAFQHSMISTLFHSCFDWVKVPKGEDYAISVKDAYKDSFISLGDDVDGVSRYKKKTKRQTVWIWKAPLPGRADVEVVSMSSFAAICTHLSDSRSFRGTDDGGLSAWSGGYLSVGGYTKFQHSVCRKLSIILGALHNGSGKDVIVHDDNEGHRKYMCEVLAYRKIKGVKFVVSKNDKFRDPTNSSFLIVSTPTAAIDVHFLNTALMTAKKQDWAKVDAEQSALRKAYFPHDLKRQVIITCHVNSGDWWLKSTHEDPRLSLFVSAVTSIHNLYPVVSNFPIHFAAADEVGGPLRVEAAQSFSLQEYKDRVVAHNKARNLFYLFPTYSFSARMNMLIPKEKEKLVFTKLNDYGEGEKPDEEGFGSDVDDEDDDDDETGMDDDSTGEEDTPQDIPGSDGEGEEEEDPDYDEDEAARKLFEQRLAYQEQESRAVKAKKRGGSNFSADESKSSAKPSVSGSKSNPDPSGKKKKKKEESGNSGKAGSLKAIDADGGI